MTFELDTVMGRRTLAANSILRKWAEERGDPGAAFEVVAFLDSVPDDGGARAGDEADLVATLDRPGITLLQGHAGGSRFPRALLLGLSAATLLALLLPGLSRHRR